LPVQLIRDALQPTSCAGETRNLCSGGVLFACQTRVDIGEPIEYVINLTASGDVNLHCLGTVLRVETGAPGTDPDKPFGIAVSLYRYEFIRLRN
jgi:hypothetical protein